MTVTNVTDFLAVLTIIGQVGVVLVVLGWAWRKTALRPVYTFLSDIALQGALVVILGSVFGSLYFSQIALFPPCELCWYQRILMYPQVVLIGLTLTKKNRDFAWQSYILSGLGFLTALYQTYLQYGGSEIAPCSVQSFAISCAQQNFLAFGYITLPVMALTGFAMLLVATLLYTKRESQSEAGF